MNTSETRQDLLLKEYSEACQAARRHEQLSRTSVSVFIPVLVALAGYLLGAIGAPLPVKLGLSIVGFLLSLLLANLVRRHQLFYRSYVKRARDIEATLQIEEQQVMRLYTDGEKAAHRSYTITNKTALIGINLVGAAYFGASAMVYASRIICGP